MRLILTIIGSCLLGVTVGILSVDIDGRFGVWYPEREVTGMVSNVVKPILKVNPMAKAFVPQDTHDFGVLSRGLNGKHDFTVENRGTENLVLEVVGTSCTCTGVDVNPKTVKPGEKSIITVHWNADTSQTQFSQIATLATNDPNNVELRFTVKGLYTNPISVAPESLYVPSLDIGREKEMTFRVVGLEKNSDGSPKILEIKNIQLSDQEHFETSYEHVAITNEERGMSPLLASASNAIQVKVKIKAGLPFGFFQERVIIHTNYESEPSIEYFVKGVVQSPNIAIGGINYSKETGVLNLGKTVIGKPLTSTFTIRYLGNVPDGADLKLIKADPPFVKVDVKAIGGGSQTSPATTFLFTVEILSDKKGYWNGPDQRNMGVIEFETNLPNEPTLKFPLQFLVEGI